jgi:hypothetical protein
MASVKEQLDAARAAHSAAISIEIIVRKSMQDVLDDWDAGKISNRSIRHRLENVVRGAYRSSATVAMQHAAQQAGLPNWKPTDDTFNTDYLTRLVADVRANLREYNASTKDEVASRRLDLRLQLSAVVAAQRGYTDALISSHQQLAAKGFEIEKVWLNNLVQNTPCRFCRELHGITVGLNEEFPISVSGPKIFINLQGPPRHPRCQCYLCTVIRTLDNAFDPIDVGSPKDSPKSVDTGAVQALPASTFTAVIASLRAVVSSQRKAS